MPNNISNQIANYLGKKNINQVFSVTGGGAMFLNEAFSSSKFHQINYMHHEQACAMAAEGYARITNKPAIVNVTTGPGAINSLNGVFGAFTDSIPMIIISGQVKTENIVNEKSNLRQLGDQEAKVISMVKPICKHVLQIKKAKDLETGLSKAIFLSKSGRPGPVWIDIPIDIQMSEQKIKIKEFKPESKSNGFKIDKIISLIAQSKKPLILAGSGIRISDNVKNLNKFSKKYNLPIATAWTHDLIDSDSPLFAGRAGTIGTRAGNFCVQNCDLLIVLGSRLNIRQVSYNYESFAKNAKIIHVDIDKNELNKFYLKTDLKINVSLDAFFKEANLASVPKGINTFRPWIEWCQKINHRFAIEKEIFNISPKKINPYKAFIEISEILKEDDIIVCGNASACIIPFQTLKLRGTQRLFSNSGSASMGYDLPASIGACIADKNKRVICIAGDGSIMMNIQELETVSALGLNLKIIVINNGGYLSIKSTHENFFGKSFGSTKENGVTFPEFNKIARSLGIPSFKITKKLNIKNMKKYLDKKGPQLIEIEVDQNQEFQPKLKSRMGKDGNFITPELDDMFPFLDEEILEKVRESSKI